MEQRLDEHKMFLGSLDPKVNKPKLLEFFAWLRMKPVEINVPECRPGKLAVAFVTWESPDDTTRAVQACHNLADTNLSPAMVQAHIWG